MAKKTLMEAIESFVMGDTAPVEAKGKTVKKKVAKKTKAKSVKKIKAKKQTPKKPRKSADSSMLLQRA